MVEVYFRSDFCSINGKQILNDLRIFPFWDFVGDHLVGRCVYEWFEWDSVGWGDDKSSMMRCNWVPSILHPGSSMDSLRPAPAADWTHYYNSDFNWNGIELLTFLPSPILLLLLLLLPLIPSIPQPRPPTPHGMNLHELPRHCPSFLHQPMYTLRHLVVWHRSKHFHIHDWKYTLMIKKKSYVFKLGKVACQSFSVIYSLNLSMKYMYS